MTQVREHLPRKHEALSSNPNMAEKEVINYLRQ
jgi:hypothetical protein